jgi:hypothetical protein
MRSSQTLRQTTPLGEDTLNFPQKVARQFDGNVVFSRYLATIFAAFVRGRHNAAILVEHQRLLFSAPPYFSAHREVMPKARHANSVSFWFWFPLFDSSTC